ncbi:NAD-dependent epimerase/dehydratase family protein [Mycobacterium sp. Y57]|uniref:NAD-dependent epimerase/dehydratase family protein n=1 Tax=Mycolicibacterium xanthum TaxID=2796469 RepID=UPI001C85C26D|nr:NAD-dependent epimerase/dehydratase family protein [Mycolicibacterium xanthum]MBX7433353.1 NAD-dependent epimerase/dehydratase family protein [Mycolicibacterium xanthum]
MAGTKLVIGASGFLGSHVTRQLVERGEPDVRVLIRTTSSTRGIDGLPVDIRYGDIFDTDALRSAMAGCDVVYYCVVDARPWLRDPRPMWRTNVDGLRNVLDVAAAQQLYRFVFTSSIGTIGLVHGGLADEGTAHNWLDRGGDYIRSRVAAEEMVMRYCADRGLPGVAMCVANTYGPGDFLPTPHGGMLAAAVRGRLPFFIDGYDAEVVGIEDAALALILAGERGRVGERYIVSERFMPTREVHEIGCRAVGVAPPRWGVPIRAMSLAGYLSSAVARVRGRDTMLTPLNIRLMHIMTPLDHTKAMRELGWRPRPISEAIERAARFFTGADRGVVTTVQESE